MVLGQIRVFGSLWGSPFKLGQNKIVGFTSPLLTCLHSISLVFHYLSVFARPQVPVQFFKEHLINPSRIQHQSERFNGSKLKLRRPKKEKL